MNHNTDNLGCWCSLKPKCSCLLLLFMIIFIIHPNINLWGVSNKKEYSAHSTSSLCWLVVVNTNTPSAGGQRPAAHFLLPYFSCPIKNEHWCRSALTLSAARILKEAMTWSAVSLSVVSVDMKSIKAWKVTAPLPLGSTIPMMRLNSASPWHQQITG